MVEANDGYPRSNPNETMMVHQFNRAYYNKCPVDLLLERRENMQSPSLIIFFFAHSSVYLEIPAAMEIPHAT